MAPKPLDVVIRGKNETQGTFAEVTRSAEALEAKVTALSKPFEALKNVVAGVAGFMVVEFFRKTVEAAVEAEAAWARIGAAVSNAGIHIAGVHDQLETLFESMTKTSRFSERELADAFATLLNVTNDYRGSVENLGLVANIAVGRQMDLSQAATLVGRVMDGNTSMLKRYGIVLREDGIAPMDQLRQRFRDFAERDAETLGGALSRIANAWEKIQEAIGKAVSGGEGGKGLDGFIDRLNRLAEFIEGHHASFDRIERLFNLMGAIQTQGLETLSPFGRFMNRATGDAAGGAPEVNFGAAMMNAGQQLLAQGEERANSAQRAAERAADAWKKAQKDILAAVKERIQEVKDEEKAAEEELKERLGLQKAEGGAIGHSVVESNVDLWTKGIVGGLRVDPEAVSKKLGVEGDAIDRKQLTAQLAALPGRSGFGKGFADAFDTGNASAKSFSETLGKMAGETIPSLAQGFEQVFASIGRGGNVFTGMAKVAISAISQIAAKMSASEFAEGLAMVARSIWDGFLGPNPAAGASAAEHFAAAAAFGAIAGGASLLGGAAGGSGGSGGGSALGTSSFLNQQNALGKKTTTVVIKGGALINLSDSGQRADFIESLRELAGDGDLNFLFE